MMPIRPRLTPAIADVRRALRGALSEVDGAGGLSGRSAPDTPDGRLGLEPPAGAGGEPLVLVGLSGGADSLALAAATAFEASRAGLRAGAVIVDHGLQTGSADVAAHAQAKARALGLDPVLVLRVDIGNANGGPEAAARTARYRAFEDAMRETGAKQVLLGHTLDDQAETVLLGLARGSGPASLQGMAVQTGPYLRPLLGIRRSTTEQFCIDAGLQPWNDPQNRDPVFTRVRVRHDVLPMLERELGPGIAEALARTALQLREDGTALDALAQDRARSISEHSRVDADRPPGGTIIDVDLLEVEPPAVLQRVIRIIVHGEFTVSLSRTQTLAIAALVTDWHGQKGVDLPGIRVVRKDRRLIFVPMMATGGDGH